MPRDGRSTPTNSSEPVLHSLADIQSAFCVAMEGRGDERIASMLVEMHGPEATARLDIHRNNVARALIRSLEGLYSGSVKLMGAAFFARIAGDYARAYPPAHGRLVEYGFKFPEFVAGYESAAGYPWFADVARLELAWHRAYIAAEAPVLAIGELANVPPERMSDIELVLHPSCQWLESRYPVSAVWRIGLDEDEPEGQIKIEGGPEWLLVVRPRAEVEVRSLGEAGYRFGRAIGQGLTLGAAWEDACAVEPDFDLQVHLAGLFAGETFSDYRLAPDDRHNR